MLRQPHKECSRFECHLCDKTFSHANYKREQKEKFKCDLCDKSFGIESSYSNHRWIKHNQGTAPFACHLCPKSYTGIVFLRQHVRQHHGNAVDFECDSCDKTFVLKHSLDTHIGKNHKMKPSQIGNKHSAKDRELKDAIVPAQDSDNQEQTFACDICDKYYVAK